MDTYKGRRVLAAVTKNVAPQARRAFEDIPFHEICAMQRAARKATEMQDAALVAAFLAEGNKVKCLKPATKVIRKEKKYAVRHLNSHTGKLEYIAAVIPAIEQPIFPKKGGVVSFCAPRSRG